MAKFSWVGFLCALTATMLWSSLYPVGRLLMLSGVNDLDPLALTWIRLFLSSVFFIPFLCLKGSGGTLCQAVKTDWKKLLLLALLGNVGEGYLLLASLCWTTAARASLLANASPIFTVIIAWLLLREKASWKMLSGMIIGFAGIIVAMGLTSGADCFGGGGLKGLLGDGLALASGICWAAYTVCGAEISRKYSDSVAIMTIAFAALILLPFVIFKPGCLASLLALPWQGWLVVLYLALLVNGWANILWYRALKTLSAGALGSFGYISAGLAAVMSLIGLKEHFSLTFVLSIVMVLAGVGLMLTPKEEK
ncbi:MAG: DMT family transporter [Lentisphaerae bacterium]|nr:DMT family transporter [Lentisphaerota bacterium]